MPISLPPALFLKHSFLNIPYSPPPLPATIPRTMTVIIPPQNEANLEATRRLLAEVVNEGLATATVESLNSSEERFLVLSGNSRDAERPASNRIRVGLQPDTHICLRDGKVISLVRPNNLRPPVILSDDNGTDVKTTLNPETIFDAMRPWLMDDGADEPMLEEIGKELANSCNNQRM